MSQKISATMRQADASSPAVRLGNSGTFKPSILQSTKFRITGKVQGVYFRKFTQQKAVELNIYGWVKNEEDGSVIGVAEGRIEKLNELKFWLSTKGSPKSSIANADFEDVTIETREFSRFDIIK
jgi:acylphosphatase